MRLILLSYFTGAALVACAVVTCIAKERDPTPWLHYEAPINARMEQAFACWWFQSRHPLYC